ncbi:MAG: hypothetical protein K2X32_00650 [Phycisphaerales bacterium]|nr:hypothetical protein [Phycisphaerales bacterium]
MTTKISTGVVAVLLAIVVVMGWLLNSQAIALARAESLVKTTANIVQDTNEQLSKCRTDAANAARSHQRDLEAVNVELQRAKQAVAEQRKGTP